jgi:PAS domain S-box-containing protein
MQKDRGTAPMQDATLSGPRDTSRQDRSLRGEFFDIVPHPFLILDQAGLIREANDSACEMLDGSREMLIGLPFTALLSEDSPAWRPGETGKRRLTTPTGAELPVRISSKIVPDGGDDLMILSLEELQRPSGRLDDSESLRAVFDTLLTGIVLIDPKSRRIVDANNAALEIFGGRRKDILGKVCHRVLCPRKHGDCPIIDKGQEVAHKKCFMLNSEGRQKPIIKNTAKINLDGHEYLLESIQDLSRVESVENALEQELSIRQAFLSTIPLPLFIKDENGVYISFNEAYSEFMNIPGERLQGKTASDVWPKQIADIYNRKDKELVQEGGVQRYEGPVLDAEGNAHHVLFNKTLFHNSDGSIGGIVGVFTDLTERMQSEKRLKTALAESEAMFENSLVGIGWTNEGVIKKVNRRCADIFGYSSEEMVGRHISVIHKDQDDYLHFKSEFWKGLKADGAYTGEHPFRRKDGSLVWCRLSGKILDPSSPEPGVIWAVDDIDELKRMQEDIVTAKETAEAANLAKTRFLANMSHEIRTPLNGILGFTELTLEEPLGEEQRLNLEMVRESGQALLQILNDILDLSKIEAGKFQLMEEPFELDRLVRSTLDTFKIGARHKGLELRYEPAPDLPKGFTGDSLRIRQVLANLVGNAIKFTDEGHVEIRIRSAEQNGDGMIRLEFSVQDTGCGISGDKQEMIFESFAQADDQPTRKYQGTGLGLAISKKLVELMGGEISVESEPRRGSCFTFTIAVRAGTEDGSSTPESAVFEGLPPLKVLLAEDNEVNSLLARAMLEKNGARVTCVHTGKEALERLAAEAFDMVLMDIQMPEMDGVEATRRIREGQSGVNPADIPIVAMTAHALKGDREKFLAAGMDEYVAKPVEQDRLVEVLQAVANQLKKAS